MLHFARSGWKFPSFEQEHAFPFEDLIHLVLPGMRVQRMLLPGLERVETDEQTRRFEDRRLTHLCR